MCIRDSTERLAAAEIIRRAEEKGFKPVYAMKSLKAGDKVYWNQKEKSVILAVIGKEPVHEAVSYTHLRFGRRIGCTDGSTCIPDSRSERQPVQLPADEMCIRDSTGTGRILLQ